MKKNQAKRPHYKSNSDQKEQCLKFIVLQSKDLPLTKLSPFIIKKKNKNIPSIITDISVKNLKNEAFFIEVTAKKKSCNITKTEKNPRCRYKYLPSWETKHL